MIFAEICRRLFKGDVIDGVRYPSLYDALNTEPMLYEINTYLEKLGYQCVATEQQGGYYLVYLNPQDKEARQEIKKQFERFVQTVEPTIRFLQLCRNANDTPIITGERVEFAQILSFIDHSPVAKDELSQIVSLMGRGSTGSKNELTSVFHFLENDGYFYALNDDKTVFRATAKWELFYEQIRYIGQAEAIVPTEPMVVQERLLW